MLSTELKARAKSDIDFKTQNIDTLLSEIVVIDDDKSLYDRGILKLENKILDGIVHVNEGLQLVTDAYQDRIDSGCFSDLFWRQVGFSSGTGSDGSDEFTLECTRLNSKSYEPVGAGSSQNVVKFIGSGGTSIFYPINSNFSDEISEVGFSNFVDNQFFGFERENRYAMKFYSQPYDKDIGNTLVGEFIGTCGLGVTTLTVMQPIGLGMTFGVGQIVRSIGKLTIFPDTAKIVGVGTTYADLRRVPNVGFGSTNPQATVSILTMDRVCGAGASAIEAIQFRVLDDPDEFSSDDRKRYNIPFNQDPFSFETISSVFRESHRDRLGIGISMFISRDGAPNKTRDWDQHKKNLPEKIGDEPHPDYVPEPLVGGGKQVYKVGFAERPIDISGDPAEEGDIRITTSLNPIGVGLYEDTPSCSAGIAQSVTDSIAEAARRKTQFDAAGGYYDTLTEGNTALRNQRNSIQLGIHGIRKMLGNLNEELDALLRLEVLIGIGTILEAMNNDP